MDDFQIKLMPRAEETYRVLQAKAAKLPSDPSAPNFFQLRPYAKMLGRVNSLFQSLMDPGNTHLDQPLLESLNWLRVRSLESTLIYFFRMNRARRIGILHITEYDSTNSYARF